MVGIYTELENEIPNNSSLDPSLGVNVRVGYRAHPNFAVEAEFEWLSGADVGNNGFSEVKIDNSWIATANVYITPHILGTLGASYVIPDDDLHDFAYVSVIWGLGYRF